MLLPVNRAGKKKVDVFLRVATVSHAGSKPGWISKLQYIAHLGKQ